MWSWKRERARNYDERGNALPVAERLGRVSHGVFGLSLGVEPIHADAHHGLGRLLASEGKYDEALSHFESAIPETIWRGRVESTWLLLTSVSPTTRPPRGTCARRSVSEWLRLWIYSMSLASVRLSPPKGPGKILGRRSIPSGCVARRSYI